METRQSIIEFVQTLKARGITLVLRRNRVNAGASHKLLTSDERAFINQHRAALKEVLSDPQRNQSKSIPAPVAEAVAPEPEPVIWTHDYNTRITADHVREAGVPPGLSKREAYERARDWLEEQRQKQEREAYILSLHNAAAELRSDFTESPRRPRRSWLEEVGYE
jgi:hypothetical protein